LYCEEIANIVENNAKLSAILKDPIEIKDLLSDYYDGVKHKIDAYEWEPMITYYNCNDLCYLENVTKQTDELF